MSTDDKALSFDEWLEELKKEIRRIGGPFDFEGYEDAAGWKGYYDDGYTPKDALREDLSYGS